MYIKFCIYSNDSLMFRLVSGGVSLPHLYWLCRGSFWPSQQAPGSCWGERSEMLHDPGCPLPSHQRHSSTAPPLRPYSHTHNQEWALFLGHQKENGFRTESHKLERCKHCNIIIVHEALYVSYLFCLSWMVISAPRSNSSWHMRGWHIWVASTRGVLPSWRTATL